MTTFDRIKELAEKRGKSLPAVSADLKFSDNLFYRWKTSNPKASDLAKVADYFHVSVDYLLGREEKPFPSDADLADMIERSTHFDGKEYPDEVKQGMKDVLRAYLMGRLDDKE
ncbi:helix-turn-helix domain-containing protein [Lactococcus lactis]|uniref:Helix-turn-helix domain-containing protein n=1 Tax=Lactococcus lactis TaxID=1358 RepID=A0AAP3Z0H9_9LACT|nr:helix-turn-helix transcriptional regulator [Lactococcus lactis]MDG4976070.1 helix-turn-helix domain-containing protein [Lactococcus lactis]